MLPSENSSSSWLAALPTLERGFCLHHRLCNLCLHKEMLCASDVADYHHPPVSPYSCVCGFSRACLLLYSSQWASWHHCMQDFYLRFVILLHAIKPSLQPLSGELFLQILKMEPILILLPMTSQNVHMRGQKAYFDAKVFNPFDPIHFSVSLSQYYRRLELEKKRKYEEQIYEVEHGTISPLVFPAPEAWCP